MPPVPPQRLMITQGEKGKSNFAYTRRNQPEYANYADDVAEPEYSQAIEQDYDNPDFYHEPGPEYHELYDDEQHYAEQYAEPEQNETTNAYMAEPEVSSIDCNKCGSTFPSGNALHAHIPDCEAPEAEFYHLDPTTPIIRSTTPSNKDIPGLNFRSWKYASTQDNEHLTITLCRTTIGCDGSPAIRGTTSRTRAD